MTTNGKLIIGGGLAALLIFVFGRSAKADSVHVSVLDSGGGSGAGLYPGTASPYSSSSSLAKGIPTPYTPGASSPLSSPTTLAALSKIPVVGGVVSAVAGASSSVWLASPGTGCSNKYDKKRCPECWSGATFIC